MPNTPAPAAGPARPSVSIIAAAMALLTLSSAVLLGSIWCVAEIYRQASAFNQVLIYAHDLSVATVDLVMLAQIPFSLAGIFTSIGLLGLNEKARKRAILLSTVPIGLVAFVLLIFLGGTASGHGGPSMNAAMGFIIYGPLFIILLPFCLWWFFVLRSARIRAQFH